MAESLSCRVRDDSLANRIFNRETGTGWMGGRKIDTEIKNGRIRAERYGHTIGANCHHLATKNVCAEAGIKRAVVIASGAVDYCATTIKVKCAIAIDTIATGINGNIPTINRNGTILVGVKDPCAGTIVGGAVFATTSVDTIIKGGNSNFAVINGDFLRLEAFVALSNVDITAIYDYYCLLLFNFALPRPQPFLYLA